MPEVSSGCLKCKKKIILNLSSAEYEEMKRGGIIWEVVKDFPESLKKFFISGFCPACQKELKNETARND